jgi:hypothetical protein
MEISFLPILVCAVISIIVGSVWYGALFGKTWSRIIGADPDCMTDPVKRKEANKQALPMYGIQFVLSLLQIWVLAQFIASGVSSSGLITSLWIWLGFIVPSVAGASMWNNDSRKDNWIKFFLNAGFQLVLAIAFGLILSSWR